MCYNTVPQSIPAYTCVRAKIKFMSLIHHRTSADQIKNAAAQVVSRLYLQPPNVTISSYFTLGILVVLAHKFCLLIAVIVIVIVVVIIIIKI